MLIRQCFAALFAAALVCAAPMVTAQAGAVAAPTDWEGLVQVKSKRLDAVYLLPGADFRGYTKVMLDPTQVAFAPNWMRDMNSPRMDLRRRTTNEDAQKIAEQARTGFGDTFANAFKAAGYEVVTVPGADVLRLSPRVINLYVNAPESATTSTRTRSYQVDAGEATLALDVRDSTTGALLGRAVDHRTAGNRGNFRSNVGIASPSSNRGDFEDLFQTWAQICVKGLDEVKALSPVSAKAQAPRP